MPEQILGQKITYHELSSHSVSYVLGVMLLSVIILPVIIDSRLKESIKKRDEQLRLDYPEFVEHEPKCRFIGCSHIGEPDCGVKEAVEDGSISKVRYDNYVLLYEEMKNMRKY